MAKKSWYDGDTVRGILIHSKSTGKIREIRIPESDIKKAFLFVNFCINDRGDEYLEYRIKAFNTIFREGFYSESNETVVCFPIYDFVYIPNWDIHRINRELMEQRELYEREVRKWKRFLMMYRTL